MRASRSLTACSEIPKSPSTPLANPSGSRANKFRDRFSVFLGYEPTTPFHPRRRSPGRGDLPGAPKPSPVLSPSPDERDHHRDPRPGQEAPQQGPGLLLRGRLQSYAPLAMGGERSGSLQVYGLLPVEVGPGGGAPDRMEGEDLRQALPVD